MSELTLAQAAPIIRQALRDRSYRDTPVGLEVARYYRWKKHEWGAQENTLRDYEYTLAKLALDHADLGLPDFEPPIGTERLREFLERNWGTSAARTRAKATSVLRDFFAWAVREQILHGNPTTAISSPKRRGVERGTIPPAHVLKIISSQPRLRDRVGLRLLFTLALRKGELTAVQFKHFDFARKRLTVFGKGGTVTPVPIVDDSLLLDLEKHILERDPKPDEYLLYAEIKGPGRWDNLAHRYETVIKSERKLQPLSPGGVHNWWKFCLERADVPSYKMHEARHTRLTDFLRASGNLRLTQQLARHASIQTTADIYAHLDDADLEAALRREMLT